MKPKYSITIKDEIQNINILKLNVLETDDRSKFSTNIIWDFILQYENKNYKQCHQCQKHFYKKEMSRPEGRKIWLCQNCLEEIMNGSQNIKNI